MIKRWLYGSVALLVLLNTACQQRKSADQTKKDSTTLQTDNQLHKHEASQPGGTSYTCPMHPQIVQSAPGACPICGMDLVPVVKRGSKAAELVLSASQMQLANVTVQPVSSGTIGRAAFGNTTVLNARLTTDQEQTDVISSRVSGRIERLYVKETGQLIRKGQVLYEIYSEPLLTNQQEYLVALQQEIELGNSEKPDVARRYSQFRQAAEQKLRLYGMAPEQIATLAKTRQVQPRIPFVAPASGTVQEIAVNEGQYVTEGTLLYRLVNLSQLWVEADLYAGEASLVKVGDRVPVQIVGYETGQSLTARVTFLNPEYKAGSQILTMRAVMANPGGKFQPGQQARVLIQHGVQQGLSLPVDAVVRSGNGTVVFVQTGTGTFQPRQVQTGTETDQRVAILKGLSGTEQVAISGAYLLYSELILKKGINPFTNQVDEVGVKSTAMVRPGDGRQSDLPTEAAIPTAVSNAIQLSKSPSPKVSQNPEVVKKQVTDVYEASLKLTDALISSDAGQAKAAASRIEIVLTRVDMSQLSGPVHSTWMTQLTAMNQALKSIRNSGAIEKQRAAYAQFEEGLYQSIKTLGMLSKPAYRQYCPMAQNSKGAYWLSDKKPIRNPYFGDQMLTCGETKEVL